MARQFVDDPDDDESVTVSFPGLEAEDDLDEDDLIDEDLDDEDEDEDDFDYDNDGPIDDIDDLDD